LTSRYLDGVSIECRGDIKVRNEIINSNVKCGGSIEVELGAVVGGYYSALCGIESKEIGTEAGVKTRINVGECYLVEQKKQKVHEKLASLAKEISFISQKLEPVVKNPKAMLALNASDKERIRGMAARFRELTPERNRLKAELNDIKKEIAERANPLVIARKQIQRGVEITIGSAFEKIHRRILRPVTVIKHAKKDKLLFTSKHSLSDRAFIIQNNLLKEELEEARLKKALEEKKKTQR
jgi:hypothetical protein